MSFLNSLSRVTRAAVVVQTRAPILVPLDATKIQWELMRGDLRNAYEQWTIAKTNKEWTRANAFRHALRAEGIDPDPPKSQWKSSVVATSAIGNGRAGSSARSPSAWTTEAATQTLTIEVPPEIWQRIATLETRVDLLSMKTSQDFASAVFRLDRLELQ